MNGLEITLRDLYILVVEEEELEENNIRGFTKINKNNMNKLGNPLKRNLKP